MGTQRVVVIQDASREVSSSAIRWAMQGLSLKPGDELTLLAVIHQVNTPSTLSFIGGKKPMGYKCRVDASSMLGVNDRIVDKQVAMKKEAYENNMELIQISKLYEMQKVKFKIEVAVGPSPKEVALKSAQNLKATWVILDRQMKKDRKFFLQKLSCGISRMKQNNSIEQLRGPISKTSSKYPTENSRHSNVIYDEMVPGSPEEEDLFSIELFPKKAEANKMSEEQELMQSRSTEDTTERLLPGEIFKNSTCSICKNMRPDVEYKKDFTYAELQAATDGFSSKNCLLSKDESGFAFTGQLKSSLDVVVKKYTIASSGGETKFKSELEELVRARHENVLMLLGASIEESQVLLVYEYACNGSLNQHLSRHSCAALNWTERIKIALGVSRGLHYLHENNIIHQNVRQCNIFLTHDFEPLLGGFGITPTRLDESLQSKAFGCNEYLAPEQGKNGRLVSSNKADVYSFGVVLLELITGRHKMLGNRSLVNSARPLLKQRRYLELVDPTTVNSVDKYQLFRVLQLTEKCLSRNPKKRLSMDKVVSTLENIINRNSTFQESSYEEEVNRTSVTSASSATILSRASFHECSSGIGKGKLQSRKLHYGEMLN